MNVNLLVRLLVPLVVVCRPASILSMDRRVVKSAYSCHQVSAVAANSYRQSDLSDFLDRACLRYSINCYMLAESERASHLSISAKEYVNKWHVPMRRPY